MLAIAWSRQRFFVSLAPVLLLVPCGQNAWAQSASIQSAPLRSTHERQSHSRAPFRVLDNVEGPWVNLGVVPVRPILVTPDGIYALNTHASTVVHFAERSAVQTFPVPWGPVAIATRVTPDADELLVVCGATHVLARLDRVSGTTLQTLDLPFEPADILVDSELDHAFVSCSGADSVVEIDLATNQIVNTYAIRGKHPVFLSFDAQNRVLVAPQFSGNNSGATSTSTVPLQATAPGIVIDFATDPNVVSGLPDEDLFAIDPDADAIEPVAKATGSVLFAHGVNPATGQLWQLNTEANNKHPHLQTEASIRGFVVDNRLTIVDLPAAEEPPATSHTIVNLDDVDPLTDGVQYDAEGSIGQPYGLAFAWTGHAAICGLLTDNVLILDETGQRLHEIDLAPGSIPRAVAFSPSGDTLCVYCWGTNRIELFRLTDPITRITSLDLGFDPAPAAVKAGRELYYSARFSQNNNASCNSCHIEGRTDMLLWNLSDPASDDKGPMLTQTLASIQRNGPMHWRGERKQLSDFNPAFNKLLGGMPLDTTPGGEFDQFQAFVFSIQSPANPLEDPTRMVADQGGLAPPASSSIRRGSALRGQLAFFEAKQDVGRSCNECHMLPTGTNGDIVSTGKNDVFPKRTHLKVPQFLEMWRKEQPIVPVTFLDSGTQMYPLLGGALTHAGRLNSLFDFIDIVFRMMPDRDTADLLAYISQLDQGVAPAIHRCVHLAQATQPAAGDLLQNYLLPQARARNIDIAVYGRADFGEGAVPMRWTWNRGTDSFDAEDSTYPAQPLGFFLSQASSGTADVVFVGLPVGMGRPFGIDYDADDVANQDESALGTYPYERDSDGDSFSDGYEVAHASDPTSAGSLPVEARGPAVMKLQLMWVSATVAAVTFETDEPSSCVVEYARVGEPAQSVRESAFQRSRRVLLTGLVPSSGVGAESIYHGTLEVRDESGNSTTVALPTIQTSDFFFVPTTSGAPEAPFTVVVGALTWIEAIPSLPDTLHAIVGARIDKKLFVPGAPSARDQVVIATLLVNGVRTENFTSPLARQFTILGEPPAFPGPFVMSLPSGDDGQVQFSFVLSGLSPGDQVTLVIDAVLTSDASYDPMAPDFGTGASQFPLGRWSFPDTPAAARSLTFDF